MGGIVQSAMLVCAVSYVGGLWDYSDRPSPIWDLGIGLGLVNTYIPDCELIFVFIVNIN